MMGACLEATEKLPGNCREHAEKRRDIRSMKKRYILAIVALIAVKAMMDMLFDAWIEGMHETWRMMGE